MRWFAWKRYILIAVSAVILFMILPGAFGESDQWTHIPDDAIISAMAIAAVVVILVLWKSFTLPSRPTGRRLIAAFFVIALLAQVAGYIIEYSDPNDVGNEYFGFILVGIALAVALV